MVSRRSKYLEVEVPEEKEPRRKALKQLYEKNRDWASMQPGGQKIKSVCLWPRFGLNVQSSGVP